MSWKPEVITNLSGVWNGNILRFATKEESDAYVENLRQRWYLVTETRSIECSDPVNYQWKDGQVNPLQSSE